MKCGIKAWTQEFPGLWSFLAFCQQPTVAEAYSFYRHELRRDTNNTKIRPESEICPIAQIVPETKEGENVVREGKAAL